MAFERHWNIFRAWIETGAAWGLYGMSHATTLEMIQIVAGLGAIGATCMAIVSSVYGIRKTKREIERLERIAQQATKIASQDKAHIECLEDQIETTRVETERKDKERESTD